MFHLFMLWGTARAVFRNKILVIGRQ